MKQSTRPGAGKTSQSEIMKKIKQTWIFKKVRGWYIAVRFFIKHVIILRDASELLVKRRYKRAKKAANRAARKLSGSVMSLDLTYLTSSGRSLHTSQSHNDSESLSHHSTTKEAVPMNIVDMTSVRRDCFLLFPAHTVLDSTHGIPFVVRGRARRR
jgi:hypothetical protein